MGRNANSSTGALSDLAKGNTSLITLTGRDAFNAGDPVFLDYQLGQVVNRNLANADEALVAGGSTLVTSSVVQQVNSFAAGAVATFSDGSYIVFSSTQANASGGDNNQRFWMTLFDKQGVQMGQQVKIVSGTGPTCFSVMATTLGTSQAAYCVNTSAGDLVGIVDKNLNMVVQTTIAGIVNYSMVGTTDGALFFSNSGTYKLSAAGVVTQPINVAMNTIGDQSTLGSDVVQKTVSTWSGVYAYANRLDPFPISSGGWGILYATTSGTIRYDRFNADGTVRGTSSTLISGLNTPNTCSAAVGASGNILWAATAVGGSYWGIVSDAGTVVKAGVLLASSDPSTYWPGTRCIADANGDFFFTWSSSSGTVLNSNYVVGTTGTSKSGFPRADTAGGSPRLHRLSTGIVMVLDTAGSFNLVLSFINNSGTVVKDKIPLIATPVPVYSMTSLSGGTVFNDTLYYWQSSNINPGTTGVTPNSVLYRVDNTGLISVEQVLDVAPADCPPIMFVDANEIKVFVAYTVLRFRTSDIKYLGFYNQPWTQYSTQSSCFRVAKVGQQYVTVHSSTGSTNWTSAGAPWPVFSVTSGERTVLLGVAVTSSVAGGPVMIQTKGSVACNWTNVKSAFNQSAASPPGNSGAVLGGIATLKGIVGT